MTGCCLLTALEAIGATHCYADPQENQHAAQPSEKEPSGKDKPNSEADSSVLPAEPTADPADHNNSLGLNTVKNVVFDQKEIWTSFERIHAEDAVWLVPFGGLTAGLIATDRETSLHLFSNKPRTLTHYDSLSNFGIVGLGGGVGALFLWGEVTHDEHKSEAGLLSGEAAIDALGIVTALKYATGRARPLEGDHSGSFASGGDSFPSDHAAVAWSVAGVLTHEYPGPLTKFLAYGAATAITVARIQAKQHFTSDTLVGSGIGWLIGEQVYTSHHDPELGGSEWLSPAKTLFEDHRYASKDMGSPYVSMESWVYPAFGRLQALGYLPDGILGQRPWTRMECARLLDQAIDLFNGDVTGPNEVSRILRDLNTEFESESESLSGGDNRHAQLESAYGRVTGISGKPLGGSEAYDFGQTIVNDYGRPYEEGTNVISGASGWASAGPFIGYVRVEYQYAPAGPALPLRARQVIQQVQSLPTSPPATSVAAIGRGSLLEGYVGLQLDNWQITFGKQELWWGPDQSGPMLFSTNAAPIEMFQINRVKPFVLPGLFSHAGPIRVQYFLGRLTGQNFVFGIATGFSGSSTQPLSDQPFIHGGKISLKPSPNLELGMGFATILAGTGVPFTPHKLLQTFYSFSDSGPGSPGDPGDRLGGFDFTYRIPKLRNWITLYGDAFTNDEVSPWRRWDKAAVTSGIYMPRIPKIPKLSFRAEGIYTDAPALQKTLGPGFFYFNDRFRSGYTNDGNLIGSWIGRQGQGADAWATLQFTPKSSLQFNFRHQKVSKEFIPEGGTLNDAGACATFWMRSMMSVSASAQYETWDFPVISSTRRSDVTTSIGLTFWPHSRRTAVENTASLEAEARHLD